MEVKKDKVSIKNINVNFKCSEYLKTKKYKKIQAKRVVYSSAIFITITFCVFIALAFLATLLTVFLVNGVGLLFRNFSVLFITPVNSEGQETGGIAPYIITTLLLIILTLIVSLPLAFIVSTFIKEYASNGVRNFTTALVNITVSTPTIVIGVIGLAIFVLTFQLGGTGFSILSAALTLAIIIVPVLAQGFLISLSSVPEEYRLASFAMGASKFDTVMRVVVPSAVVGILSTIIFAIARIISESVPVVLTLGSSVHTPTGFFDQGRTLSTNIFITLLNNSSSDATEQAYVSIIVTLFFILILNLIIRFISNYIQKKHLGKIVQKRIQKNEAKKTCNAHVTAKNN